MLVGPVGSVGPEGPGVLFELGCDVVVWGCFVLPELDTDGPKVVGISFFVVDGTFVV